MYQHTLTLTLSYADDITVFSQHLNFETAATNLQEYIHAGNVASNRLKVSTTKSTLTLHHPMEPRIHKTTSLTLNGELFPYTNKLTTLETPMTEEGRLDNTCKTNTKAKTRLNVLRALTKTFFGHPLSRTPLPGTEHSKYPHRTTTNHTKLCTAYSKQLYQFHPNSQTYHETLVLPIRQHTCI